MTVGLVLILLARLAYRSVLTVSVTLAEDGVIQAIWQYEKQSHNKQCLITNFRCHGKYLKDMQEIMICFGIRIDIRALEKMMLSRQFCNMKSSLIISSVLLQISGVMVVLVGPVGNRDLHRDDRPCRYRIKYLQIQGNNFIW